MNDVDFPVAKVLEAIDNAANAGLTPVKVDMVVKRGVNDDHIIDMARHFRGSGHILRFIEYMDVGTHQRLAHGRRGHGHGDREPINASGRSSRSSRTTSARSPSAIRYVDGTGEIGIIASVTVPFCGACTRARLSADGELYTCLFGVRGHDLRAPSAAAPATRRSRRRSAHLGRPTRPLLGLALRRDDRPAEGAEGGGNSDFLNMLERERLESKKISKTNAVTSMLDYDLGDKNVHVGPSDYVPWLTDRKWPTSASRVSFGDVPLNVELKLEVWDSPNSAGIVIDAPREVSPEQGHRRLARRPQLLPDGVAAAADPGLDAAELVEGSSSATAARVSSPAPAQALLNPGSPPFGGEPGSVTSAYLFEHAFARDQAVDRSFTATSRAVSGASP